MKQREETLEALEKTLSENSSDRTVMLERFLGLQSRLTAIDDRLNSIQISRKNLALIASPDFSWIEVTSPPYKPEIPVGPRRMQDIAIAGILGLFLGVLAAFLKNYMGETASR